MAFAAVLDHDDLPQPSDATNFSNNSHYSSPISTSCSGSCQDKLEEAMAEIFRLKSKVSFYERRDEEFQSMLREKNENEDRLRSLVNELQLSLELAKISHSSTFAAEQEIFKQQEQQSSSAMRTPPTQPATPMMASTSGSVAPPIGLLPGTSSGSSGSATPPPEGATLSLGSSFANDKLTTPNRQFKIVSKVSKEAAARAKLPSEGAFVSSPQRKWAVVVPSNSPSTNANVCSTSNSQQEEEEEALDELLHAGFKRMRLEE